MTVLSPSGRHIQEALAIFLRREPSTITPEQHLRDDLGLDSLMIFELLYELEKTFDLEIPNEDLPCLQTLDDLVSYVDARVPSSLPPAKAAVHASRAKEKTQRPKPAAPSTNTTPGTSKARVTTTSKKRSAKSTGKKRAVPAQPKRKKP